MKQIKSYVKMLSPFNNWEEMPSVCYVIKKLLAFFVCYWAAAIIGEGVILGGLYLAGYDALHGVMPSGYGPELLKYYGFAVYLLVTIWYCKCIEKRTISTMGFNRKVADYLLGGLAAVLLLCVIIGICCGLGGLSYVGFGKEMDGIYLAALLGGLMVQSAAEEALSRGFLLISLKKKVPVWLAVFCSATAFAYPHFSNLTEAPTQYCVVGIINLYLISIIFSMLMLCRTNIWIACGLHGIWNYLLYGVFGLTLSGSDMTTQGVLCFEAGTANIINGGQYGIEASIVTTIVLGAAAALLCVYWKKKGDRNGI